MNKIPQQPPIDNAHVALGCEPFVHAHDFNPKHHDLIPRIYLGKDKDGFYLSINEGMHNIAMPNERLAHLFHAANDLLIACRSSLNRCRMERMDAEERKDEPMAEIYRIYELQLIKAIAKAEGRS